jgi:hypothetical protein
MRRLKWLTIITVIIVAIIILTSSLTHKEQKTIAIKKIAEKGFVVMELFTSQGCSSCPPADKLLGKYVLKNDDNIIPLAFHVDYWNRLGWIDSFSSDRYSQRQREYAAIFNLESVYTPQLVINGKHEMVGSAEEKIWSAVTRAFTEKPSLLISIDTIIINGEQIKLVYKAEGNITNATIQLALIQHESQTKIKAGENRGIKLNNYNVVRDFVSEPFKKCNWQFNCTLTQKI